uniref:Ig-like domain-containing protein n=1 Tax=Mastacembelus armatus TaxID=205130 RepID=A0A7N8X623_9TELE
VSLWVYGGLLWRDTRDGEILSKWSHTESHPHEFLLNEFLSAVTMETVVGFAGRRVTLPCRLEEKNQRGVEVCWGRGEPSLFTCHNTVVNAAVNSSETAEVLISVARPSDSGLYHCRVQLPGLFNDQISTEISKIIKLTFTCLTLVSVAHELESSSAFVFLCLHFLHHKNMKQTQCCRKVHVFTCVTGYSRETGSDVSNTGPMVGLIQVPSCNQHFIHYPDEQPLLLIIKGICSFMKCQLILKNASLHFLKFGKYSLYLRKFFIILKVAVKHGQLINRLQL